VGTTEVVPCAMSVLVCGWAAIAAGSVLAVAAVLRVCVPTSEDVETGEVAGGTTALGPRGSVPRETAGRFETGRPETGETPGVVGATVRPGGRLPASVPLARLEFTGVSVSSTGRLGSEGLVFGVAGGRVDPETLGVVADGVCPVAVGDAADDADVEPLVLELAEVPVLLPELPLPPPVPPL
jgi:hypothetical protein